MPNKFTDIRKGRQQEATRIAELRAIFNLFCPPRSPLEQEVVEVFANLEAAWNAVDRLFDKIEAAEDAED